MHIYAPGRALLARVDPLDRDHWIIQAGELVPVP